MAKGDNRAVVGASGKPTGDMVLTSGTKDVARAMRHPDGRFKASGPGVKFEIEDKNHARRA